MPKMREVNEMGVERGGVDFVRSMKKRKFKRVFSFFAQATQWRGLLITACLTSTTTWTSWLSHILIYVAYAQLVPRSRTGHWRCSEFPMEIPTTKQFGLMQASTRMIYSSRFFRIEFFQSIFYSREWISPAAVTYVIDSIVSNWDSEAPEIRAIDWYILPVMNPDGYEFTFRGDRLWRKNRRRHTLCAGTDLNR